MRNAIKDIEAKLTTVVDFREKADLLNELSWELRLSDPRRGLDTATKAMAIAQQLSDPGATATSLCYRGINYFFLSEFDQAINELGQALVVFGEIGDKKGQALVLNWMGNACFSLSDYSRTLQYHFQSLQLRKEIGDQYGQACSLGNIGNVYSELGDYEACLEYYHENLNIDEKIGNKHGIAAALSGISHVYQLLGDFKSALGYQQQSFAIDHEIGNHHGEMISSNNIGEIFLALGEYDRAIEYFQKGLAISEELGEFFIRAGLWGGIGSVHQQMGNNDSAFEYYNKGLAMSRQVGYKVEEQSILMNLGLLHDRAGRPEEGLDCICQSLALAEELKSMPMIAKSNYALSQVFKQRNDYQKALMHYQRFHDADKEIFNDKSDKKRQATMIRFQVEQKEKEAEIYRLRNVELAEANQAITQAKEIIEEKNRHITSSIEYARRIQQAVLPPAGKMQAALPEHFVLFKPRDIVSGDFYWFSQTGGKILIAVVDCTGHGVPGAFMSMIGSMLLNTIVNENGETGPAKVLEQLHVAVRSALKQHDAEADTTDGMDVCLCAIDQKAKQLVYAGAKRPLYLVRDKELTEIAGDGKSIGGRQKEEKRAFSDNRFELQDGDMLYLTSDGYSDQCDPEGRKIGSRRLKELLLQVSEKSYAGQRAALLTELEAHQASEEQRDDIAIVGVRI